MNIVTEPLSIFFLLVLFIPVLQERCATSWGMLTHGKTGKEGETNQKKILDQQASCISISLSVFSTLYNETGIRHIVVGVCIDRPSFCFDSTFIVSANFANLLVFVNASFSIKKSSVCFQLSS